MPRDLIITFNTVKPINTVIGDFKFQVITET